MPTGPRIADPGVGVRLEGWRPDAPAPMVTVVVPTFNERDNVIPLLARLQRALPVADAEVLFVDDSADDTPEVIRGAAAMASLPVRLLHRELQDRPGGLGGAVVAGLHLSTAEWVLVMDADLQHPPESVPSLLAAAGDDCDLVVASRYLDGGSAGGLAGALRRYASSGAGALAKVLFPRRMANCSDPMSGFFAVRRSALDLDRLQPDGFKILLEIIARSERLRIAEVPFEFAARQAGRSKAGLKQGLVYLRHLLGLRTGGVLGRLAGFLAVGGTGVLVNLATMALLLWSGVHYLLAAIAATAVSVTSNFTLSDTVVFRARRHGPWYRRYLRYAAFNSADLPARIALMAVLVDALGFSVMVATVTAIGALTAGRFALVDQLIYRRRQPAVPRQRSDSCGVLEPGPADREHQLGEVLEVRHEQR